MMAFSVSTKIFLLITLLSALALTAAKPILPRDANTTLVFDLHASHSGDTHIHLLPLNANGGNFWVGGPLGEKDTASYCPIANQSLCPPGELTEFLGKPGLSGVSMVSPSPNPTLFIGRLAHVQDVEHRSPRWPTTLRRSQRSVEVHTGSFRLHASGVKFRTFQYYPK